MKIILRYRLVVLQIFFWVLYATYSIYETQAYLGWLKAFGYVGLRLFFLLTACYLHYFFIFPVWLKNKQLTRYIILTLLMVAGVVVVRIFTENAIIPLMLKTEGYYQTVKLSRVISTIWDTVAFTIFIALIRFTIERFDLEAKQKALENEKLMTELNYLKAQINPHFLFNTLHNLNALVYSGSTAANDVIIKLSNIMRYMIYEASKPQVSIHQEVAYLEDYIHLESIRFNHIAKIEFQKIGVESPVMIAPLILITLVENAFKHGVRNEGDANWITINLTIKENLLTFVVSNKIAPVDTTRPASGFGLENLHRRLELSYPNGHQLISSQQDQTYTIHLTLTL